MKKFIEKQLIIVLIIIAVVAIIGLICEMGGLAVTLLSLLSGATGLLFVSFPALVDDDTDSNDGINNNANDEVVEKGPEATLCGILDIMLKIIPVGILVGLDLLLIVASF